MSRYSRTRIVTTTREVIAIRQTLRTRPGLICTRCEAKTVWLELDEAVARCAVAEWELVRLVEEGIVHFREPAGGRALLCGTSLMKYLIEKER